MYRYAYTLTGEVGGVLRQSDGAFIPLDEENVDYIDFLAWLSAGNEVLPADEVVGE